MNKPEFVKEIAYKSGMTQRDTAKFLDAFNEVVAEALSNGEKVELKGFGTFFLKEREARMGKVFGVEAELAASKSVGFKVGKTLKDSLN